MSKQKLQITLNEEATENYLKWVTRINQAHADEDLEFCGSDIRIELGGILGSTAYSLGDGDAVEFGDADVELIE